MGETAHTLVNSASCGNSLPSKSNKNQIMVRITQKGWANLLKNSQ